MVNEIALIMLWGLFGWKIALIYTGTGVVLAIASGIVIGKLKMEKYVQDYVWQIKARDVGDHANKLSRETCLCT